MKEIHILEQETIDKIAAGEVVERPGSIVKELCENALDAGASAITVEIRDGGISMIRVTDNGEGIDPSQVRNAFLRHATSKITQVDDLVRIRSFGFRGEALSSISAVSRMELITKVRENLTGIRYKIEGGSEKLFEEVGAPEGSTFIVRDLFYNTPARKKFLKSSQTEAGYISDFVNRLALSNPHIAVKFMVNSSTRLSTSGYGSQADVINAVFGSQVREGLIRTDRVEEAQGMRLKGWIGEPRISRGNRNCEILYVNGRLVYNNIFSKAIEEGYETFLMQHRFPFVILALTLPGNMVDVNVHPAKAQVRFSDGPAVFQFVKSTVKELLNHREMIVSTGFGSVAEEARQVREAQKRAREAGKEKDVPEPFEELRRKQEAVPEPSEELRRKQEDAPEPFEELQKKQEDVPEPFEELRREHNAPGGYLEGTGQGASPYQKRYPDSVRDSSSAGSWYAQMSFFDSSGTASGENGRIPEQAGGRSADTDRSVNTDSAFNRKDSPSGDADNRFFLRRETRSEHRLIGQLFETNWIIEFRSRMYISDQHAAQEQVLFERPMEQDRTKSAASQMLSPAMVVPLSLSEESLLRQNLEAFRMIGFEIEPFGGHDYMISAVPQDLFGLTEKEFFLEMLDSLSADAGRGSFELITMRVAAMACKAAVKGNTRLSFEEADELISELLTLDNPYNCPHGRPTILSMTKAEIEKKFHRIV